jgi:hypothetical protein
MNIKSKIISSFASFIIGSDTFDRVKNVVIRQDEKNISGNEKREAAVNEIKLIGMGIATWAINLAIELAVSWLRTKVDK